MTLYKKEDVKMKIIDVHAHVFPEAIAPKATAHLHTYYSYKVHGTGTIDDLKKSAEESGVEKLVIHSTATKAEQVENINNFVSGLIDENIAGFGSIHRDYENFEKEIDRIISLGLKGIKLHPDFQSFDIDDKKMFPVYECIGERLPVLIHLGDENSNHSQPKKLAKVMEMFPKLKIIGAHMGGYSRWDEAEECLLGKNLYIDTSSTFRRLTPKEVTRLINKHDINKVLFGTDYPLERHSFQIERTLELELSDDKKEKIFYDNAYNLLFK